MTNRRWRLLTHIDAFLFPIHLFSNWLLSTLKPPIATRFLLVNLLVLNRWFLGHIPFGLWFFVISVTNSNHPSILLICNRQNVVFVELCFCCYVIIIAVVECVTFFVLIFIRTKNDNNTERFKINDAEIIIANVCWTNRTHLYKFSMQNKM